MFVGPNNAISASVFKKLPFDFLRDTAPVGGIMTLINIMVVPPSLPVKTVAEFIAYGKANPGKLNMASPGAGTSPHMSGELFKMLTGIEMQHVPYRGAGPAYPDLMTGKVDVFFDNLPGSVELVKTGKLRALAVTSAAALVRLPRPAVDRRDHPGLRRHPLLRRLGAEGHAARHDRGAEQGDERRARGPEDEERIAGSAARRFRSRRPSSASWSPTRR